MNAIDLARVNMAALAVLPSLLARWLANTTFR
jgi:hypothetical protein